MHDPRLDGFAVSSVADAEALGHLLVRDVLPSRQDGVGFAVPVEWSGVDLRERWTRGNPRELSSINDKGVN